MERATRRRRIISGGGDPNLMFAHQLRAGTAYGDEPEVPEAASPADTDFSEAETTPIDGVTPEGPQRRRFVREGDAAEHIGPVVTELARLTPQTSE